MKVKWLGHAAFLITAQDGTRILTDPYEAGYGALGYDPINETADIVLHSHQHADHCGLPVGGNPQVVADAGAHHAKGIEFRGLPTYHDTSGGKERGKNIVFCFTVDGVRICHLGDLGHLLSEKQLAEIGDVDVLLVPVGGYYTIGVNEATQICSSLKPRVVIPMHVGNDKCAFPIATTDDFVRGKANVRRLGSSEAQFSPSSLPATTEILVLDHAL